MKLRNIYLIIFSILSINAGAQITNIEKVKIDSLFHKWDNDSLPGAVIGIVKNGELIYSRGYGMANLDYNIPLSVDSKFNIASVTKQFTASCVALLCLDGKIDLDETILKYIPEFPEYGKNITIRHLIHHTSGIRNYSKLLNLIKEPRENYFSHDDGINMILRQKKLNYVPGEKYQYTNSGYLLLVEIIQRVSGMPIREYAEKFIFSPLAMKNTLYKDDCSQVVKDRVVSYSYKKGTQLRRYVQNWDAIGGGGLITTVNDFYLWDRNFSTKKWGNENYFDLIQTKGILNNGDTISYAFGLDHGRYKGLKTISHAGLFLAFKAQYIRFPEQHLSVIVFTNASDINPKTKSFRIADILLKDKLEKREDDKTVKPSFIAVHKTSVELEKYCGHFWNPTIFYIRKTYIKNDTLRFYRGEGEIESLLLPIGDNEFKMLGLDYFASVKFEFEDNKLIKNTAIFPNRTYVSNAYDAVDYYIENDKKLRDFSGLYYSRELNCVYELRNINGKLKLFINDKDVSELAPLSILLFNLEHMGTIEFNEKNIKEFKLDSNTVKNIKFVKI